MKYYIGRMAVFNEDYESTSDACLVAANEAQANELLQTRAALFIDAPSRLEEDGCYRFEGYEVLAVKPLHVVEISAVTFQELSRLLPVFGDSNKGALEGQSDDERVKTLARRIGEKLGKLDAKVAHGKLLHAVAASLGETDWQVLSHKAAAARGVDEVRVEAGDAFNAWSANHGTQPFVPGNGYLWRVPVTIDTTMTAFVKVRAKDRDDAVELARRFASEGNARFEVDDGNYRGMADHYIGDPESIECIEDDEGPIPEQIREKASRAQHGPYLVELFDLDDGADALLWADLSIFDPEEEEPDTVSCLSACAASSSPEEAMRFCERIAQLLHRAAPDLRQVDPAEIRSMFTQAVQGDQSDEAFEKLARRLQASQPAK